MRIAVIGLGKLGLPLAETLALRHTVAGYDISPRTSDSVLMAASLPEAVEDAVVVLIVLPTPHDREYDGSAPTSSLPPRDFGYEHVIEALAAIDRLAPAGTEIGVVSTLLPGTTRRELAPLASRTELLATPALMASGRVREDFLDPEFNLIGSDNGDAEAGAAIQEIFRDFAPDAPLHLVTWEEAEAIKVFYNGYVTFKLALVNMIQDVVERVGHANVDAVTRALADGRRRVTSSSYLRAGMCGGGPCHPRDLVALRYLADSLDLGYDLFGAVGRAREAQARNLAACLAGFGLPVLMTSGSFKPDVPYTDGAPGLLVAHYVVEEGLPVRFLDAPAAVPAEPHAVLLVHDVDHADLVLPAGSVVVDPWRRYVNPELRVIHYGDTQTGR